MATQTPTIITQGTQAQDGSGVNKYNPNTGNLLLPGQSVSINPPTIPAGIALGSTQPLPTQPKQNNAIVTNANANINGYLEQQPLEQQVNNNLQTTQQEYQSANQSYQQGILDLINNRQQKVSDLQGQTGFTKASMDYNQATAKINSLDQQAALERKATLENRSLTLEDQQRRLNALEITNTINKTDALIDYNIKKGSYDAIKELTDQKINIMMQDDAMRIDALKTQKEDLKGFFTSAQDKQFNVMIKKQEQAFQEKQDKLKFQQSLQLKAIDFSRELQKAGYEGNLTADQIKGVKSYSDLAKLKGQFGIVTPKGTDAQFTSATYANRMEQAQTVFNKVLPNIKSANPVAFKAQLLLPSYLQPPEVQEFAQATKNFITAQLRKESGAAISPEEFKTAYAQYIPAPGDSSEVLKQKEQNRLLNTKNLINAAGTAYVPLQEEFKATTKTDTGTTPSGVTWKIVN